MPRHVLMRVWARTFPKGSISSRCAGDGTAKHAKFPSKPAKFFSKIASSVQDANLRIGGFCSMFVQRVRISWVLFVAVCFFLAREADAQPIAVPRVEVQRPVTINVPRVQVQKPVSINVPRVQVPSVSVQPVRPATLPPIAPNGQPYNIPYPLTPTPANEAWARQQQANHQLENIQAEASLTARKALQSKSRTTILFKPTSQNRYNIQFSNDQVQALQSTLRRLGYYPGAVDGIFGPETEHAVQSYQSANQLPSTGQPDQILMTRLGIL
jgi:Putative peptidoglycan binding domain